MKRALIAAALLLVGVIGAQADTTFYQNILKQPRSDAQLHSDEWYCDQQASPGNVNGVPTSAQYKKCMLSRGWRYQYTRREAASKTWIDPDTGLTCHAILGGFGSECSNY
jgi:hypothetical protein